MNANERIETVLAPQPAPARRNPRVRPTRALHRAGRAGPGSLARALDPTELEGPAARASELASSISRRVRGRPWLSLAVALGVGFVVGGALSCRAGRIAIAAAARHVGRELLKQVL